MDMTLLLLQRIACSLENLVALKVIDATIAISTASPALQLALPKLVVPTALTNGALGSAPSPPPPTGP